MINDKSSPITGLLLKLWIPVHVEQEEVVPADEIESDAAGRQRQEEDLGAALLQVERVHDAGAVLHGDLA